MSNFINAFRHFHTITKHRHKVIAHSKKAGILRQGLFHDLSKYTPTEFIPGMKFYKGTRSPNEGERELYGYSQAWLHHKGRNKHHFEYWTDYNPETKKVEPVKMPWNYVVEMFCDRLAASKIYEGKNYTPDHPLMYFQRSKARRFIHPETSDEIENLLAMIKEKGEKETFSYIRKQNKIFKTKKH